MFTPWLMLALVLLILMIVLGSDRMVSRGRALRLRRLAERFGFRYSSVDRFGLARRVRPSLPAAANDVIVRDLMYRSDGAGYIYAFTAVYCGGTRGRVVLHARERCGDSQLHDIRRAEETLPLGEQYRRLLNESAPPAV